MRTDTVRVWVWAQYGIFMRLDNSTGKGACNVYSRHTMVTFRHVLLCRTMPLQQNE